MLTNNNTLRRCLVLSAYTEIQNITSSIFNELNLLPDFANSWKEALGYFLQYKHFLLLVDARFLPRFPYRLLQLFKIAHREPAVVVLNETGKNLAGFYRLDDCCIKIIEPPVSPEKLSAALREAEGVLRTRVHSAFIKNMAVQIGVLLPLLIITMILFYWAFMN